MGDLSDPRLIYLKGFLFLVIGIMAVVGILVENPSPLTAFLLLLTVWSFCRLYYFMFYVIEKYVDDSYRFAGISSFLIYLFKKRIHAERDVTSPAETSQPSASDH